MGKFIEFIIDGKNQSINIDNIAKIKQIDINITEITLLSKNSDGNQEQFKVAYNYGYFKALLQSEDKYGFNAPLSQYNK